MDGLRAADGFDTYFGEADVADVSGFDEVGDGSDGVFDGDFGVEARGAVDVDVIDPEALEAVGERSFLRLRGGCRRRSMSCRGRGVLRTLRRAGLDRVFPSAPGR